MCYELKKQHVGLSHISPVIESVLKFAGKKVSQLPKESTLRNMNKERLILAQAQLADEFKDKEQTTLYSDETSKKTEKYMGFHASDKEKNTYVLGIRDQATKSAVDTLNTFKEVLMDIDDMKKDETTEVQYKCLIGL